MVFSIFQHAIAQQFQRMAPTGLYRGVLGVDEKVIVPDGYSVEELQGMIAAL